MGKRPYYSINVMLDSIHEKFNNKTIFLRKIIDNTNPIITFFILRPWGIQTNRGFIKMNLEESSFTTFCL
jgi:hypothetical protein